MKEKRTLIDAFNNAIEGILYTFKSERNMKIHYACAIIVLLASLFLNFDKIEMILLILITAPVLITEMINTAIEKAIDGITTEQNPLLKIAKDVSAGAVLLSSIVAVIGGYLLFYDKIAILGNMTIDSIRSNNTHITIISIILVLISVIVLKTLTPKGTPLKGGMPSGHSALAFSIATIITFTTRGLLPACMSYLLALLIAQSRVEGKIHTFLEILVGAILGVVVTLTVFQIANFKI